MCSYLLIYLDDKDFTGHFETSAFILVHNCSTSGRRPRLDPCARVVNWTKFGRYVFAYSSWALSLCLVYVT